MISIYLLLDFMRVPQDGTHVRHSGAGLRQEIPLAGCAGSEVVNVRFGAGKSEN